MSRQPAIPEITLPVDFEPTIEALLDAGERSLAPGELYCVWHPDGPLEQTASRSFIDPIRIICGALDMDWDDLQEQGFALGKIRLRRKPR